MPRRLAMSTIVTRCQQRADLENDSHIATTEWRALISEKYGELYGTVCDAGLRYFETISTFTATGAAGYDEPDDHMATIGFDFISTGGTRTALVELMPGEAVSQAGQTGEACYFTIVDDIVSFYPNPASGTYVMRYVPQSPDLSAYADASLVDLINADGEAFLIWGVSVLAKSKSESDVRLAIEREAAARDRLLVWAVNRSMNEGRRRPMSDGFFDPFADGGP